MSATSSGGPGGSERRMPSYMDPTNQFGELTFLLLTGKNDAPLPKNPFLIGTSVEKAAGGPIEGAISEAQSTRYTLKIRNPSQVTKLLKMSSLIDGTEVVVAPHPNLNVSRCVISCFDMIDMEEEEILRGLGDQMVIRVQRITRKENSKSVNTPAIILTFSKSSYPSHIKIGLLRIATRPYYPNPLLCYGCFRYGHPRVRCPGPQRCLNCSDEHHLTEGTLCTEAAHCINCGGDHRSNNRQCPIYQTEMKIIRLKVDQKLTYPEARKRVQDRLENYATAAAAPNSEKRKLDELDKKLNEKDAQIAQLMEKMKHREDYIEKLVAHVKNLREQVQPSGRTPIAGTSMQLRNRSPAVAESIGNETNKKNKRQNKKNNTSPGRQSPPLKKQPAENERLACLNQEMIDIDDESDTTETPTSQSIRRS